MLIWKKKKHVEERTESKSLVTPEEALRLLGECTFADSRMVSQFVKHRKYQTECRLKCGDRWTVSDRIFTQWDGKPVHPDTLSNWFRDFIKKTDLPDIPLHSLRHTNATLQIANGVPVTTVSSRLGHATANTTTRIYAHAIKSADEAAAETLSSILNPKPRSGKEKSTTS